MTIVQEDAVVHGEPEGLRLDEGRLIVRGEDRPGVVAAVSTVLVEAGANIVALDQYSTDPAGGRFFQRTVFRIGGLQALRPKLEAELRARVGGDFGLDWQLVDTSKRKRVAILASRAEHCLIDLLWRQRRGELDIEIEMVISNHIDVQELVRSFGVPFFHVPVVGGDKRSAEREHLRLMEDRVDFVVLARYMQILSGEFIRDAAVPIINIHHSFLPAFIGAGPYQKAKDRGVKLIGATAHYVTEDLDEGPIIEQGVQRVSHADMVSDLQRRGADIERAVLSRAVAWHSEDRVIRDGSSTIVFAQ